MKTEKLSNTIGLYLLVGIGAMIAIGLLVVKPQFNLAEKTRLETASVDKKTADLRQLGADTEKLRTNYEDVKADKNRILNLLPVATEEENLVVMISNIAQKSGVVLNNYTPEVPGAGAPAASLLMSPLKANISVVGAFPAVQEFLVQMEKSGRFMSLISGNYSAATPQGATKAVASIIQLQINLTAYYQAAAVTTGAKL